MKRINKFLSTAAASVLLVALVHFPPSAVSPETHSAAKMHPALSMAASKTPDSTQHVIVQTVPGTGLATREQATKLGGVVTAQWDFINSFVIDIPAGKLTALAALPDVLLLTQEQNLQNPHTSVVDSSSLANTYNFTVNADKVWAQGYNGAGVSVAVVDSGVFSGPDFNGHPDVNVKFNSNTTYLPDKYGHGTHVAGIIAGNGNKSAGKYIGIAPGVNLINVKFSDDDGSASEKDLVDALQWVYEHRTEHNIRVVNISSTVGTKQSYRESAVAAAVEQLWFSGVVVVVSAGNKGGELCSTCYAPANDPYVITVGATDDKGTRGILDDVLKPWSSSGLTLDAHAKPDLVAPGSQIISYMPNGKLRDIYPQNIVDTSYFRMGGTSMAAPVVTGTVALMLQAHPEWTPDQVKWVLTHTTRSNLLLSIGSPGIVNAEAAVFYPSIPDKANRNLLPSPFIDGATGAISDLTMTWGNMMWGNMTWGNNFN